MTTKVKSMVIVMPNAEYQANDAVSATSTLKIGLILAQKFGNQLKYGDANIEPPTALKAFSVMVSWPTPLH